MPDSSSQPVRVQWKTIVWFTVLLIGCYAPVLARLVKQWENDEDMGHGFFVPVLAAYIAWQKRDRILAAMGKSNGWGLALVIYAAFQLTIATLGAEIFLARTAFVFAVIGSFLYMGGTALVRVMAFPLFLLFFMIPIPAILYNMVTFPLQLLASQMAESTLMFIGLPVLREGNVLELAGQKLQVVEACSGIRSLLSLTFLSLVYGFFFERMIWMRVVLFFTTVPVALVANASRVTVTGILSEIRPELAKGFFHSASGWVIFMVALTMLLVIHQILLGIRRFIYARQPAS